MNTSWSPRVPIVLSVARLVYTISVDTILRRRKLSYEKNGIEIYPLFARYLIPLDKSLEVEKVFSRTLPILYTRLYIYIRSFPPLVSYHAHEIRTCSSVDPLVTPCGAHRLATWVPWSSRVAPFDRTGDPGQADAIAMVILGTDAYPRYRSVN